MKVLVQALLYGALLVIFAAALQVPSDEECLASLGFNRANTQCVDCDLFGSVAGDTVLRDECLQCCSVRTEEKFQLAVIELDEHYAARLSNVKSIIKAADALNVVLRYRIGSRPTLLMYKERTDDTPEVELNIFSWTLETFKEYISDHI
jgi:hypothetical protein